MNFASLESIPLFTGVDGKTLRQMEFDIGHFGKGETVHNQRDECVQSDVVLEGGLVAYSLSQNGSENTAFHFAKGSIIGANLLFGDMNLYPMNIYCTEDSVILRIDRAQVEQLLHDVRFAMNFIKSISQNSQGMNRRLALYTQKSLKDNLMAYLEAQSAEQGSKKMLLPISKKQLADYLGVQRQSLFRVFKNLEDEGLISVENRKITLL